MSMPTEGRVEYGARAFEQDASLAIRGDVIRALIELITNSDDAYGAADGEIWVHVTTSDDDVYTTKINVIDSAKGLTAAGLQKAFAVLGGERDDDDGAEEARGLLGRGAKDVASLGRIEFAAIRDGKYSRLVLQHTGEWKLTDIDVPATDDHRQALALDEGSNGLTATLYILPKFKTPTRNQLQDKLSRHAQLRDLMARRPVYLKDDRDVAMLIRLDAPARLGTVVIDTDIVIEGYAPVHLTVRRLPQRATTTLNEYSEQGLLIRSGVSVFQNTWFDLDSRPEAAYFAGEVDAEQIATIIRAFDRGESIGGPLRLLSRDRDGLVKNHPYRKELARAITREVQPLFDALSKQMDAGKRQGEQLNRAFKVAGAALKDSVVQALQEIEDEDDTSGGGGDDQTPDMAIIPPRRVIAPGQTATLTVRASASPEGEMVVVVEKQSAEDVVAAVATSDGGWKGHSRVPGVVVTQVYVDAGLTQGSATLRAEVGGRTARAEIVVTEVDPHEEDPPTTLTFTTAKASVSPTRTRRLELRAPIDYADETVTITYEGTDLAEYSTEVTLRADTDGLWSSATVRCKAGAQIGAGIVTAHRDDEAAVCALTIAETSSTGGLTLEFDLSGHKSPSRRVELTNDQGAITVRVYALHATFNGIFGKYSEDDGKFTNEDSAQARAVLAEVVAAELAAHLTERDYNRRPEQLNDAPRVLFRRTDLANRFVGILHRALTPTPS